MRLASLDLGTNTLLLTIADWNGTTLTHVYEDANLIRLGQDLKERGSLHPDAKARTLNALGIHCDIVNRYDADKTVAVATEALRKASDASEFLAEIKQKYGISFTVLSPQEEAALTFKATQKEFSQLKQDLLMFDIGGGSTEIVCGDRKTIQSITSLEIGTVSLTEEFILSDPIEASEVASAEKFIRSKLAGVPPSMENPAGIGIAGTVTTLKAVTLQMVTYDHSAIHTSTLTRKEIDELLKLFASMTLAERVTLKGLPEKRADIIPAGALITQAIMDVYGLSKIYVSDRGLRWGVLYDWVD